MTKRMLIALISISAMFAVIALAPAADAAGEVGDIFSSEEPGTVGPGISGELYGNTSNPSGNGNGVLPSLSPGPWLCAGVDCAAQPTEAGPSVGDLLAPLASGGKASPDFADVGVDEDISHSVDEIFGLDPDVEDDLIDPDFDAALQDFDDFLEAPVSIFP
jgi:hypothetical protein